VPATSAARVRLVCLSQDAQAFDRCRLNTKTGKLEASQAVFTTPPSLPASLVLRLFALLGLVRLTWSSDGRTIVATTNLTLISAVLVVAGPMSEAALCSSILAVQVAGSAAAFGVRYGLASLFYGPERR
jgi:UDP-N-acetylglucosamine--dolichyl-phosphate N-acetylglucosaminephosphotransferase